MSGSRVLLLPFIETLGALQAVFTSFSIAPAVEIDLAAIFDLDHATNDRLLAENDLLPGIDTHELIFGISYYRIMNAAFCHAQPLGSRFNGPDRGAWYAAFEIETAQAEVAFHKALELAEVGWKEESVTYDDYLADFSGEFHIRTGYRRTDVRGSDFAGETRHKPPVEVGSV